jgi:hypothetical protein
MNDFICTNQQYLDQLVLHSRTKSITDILVKLITNEDSSGGNPIFSLTTQPQKQEYLYQVMFFFICNC